MLMKEVQKVVLNPLSTEDAMRVLLRLQESIDNDEADYNTIGENIRRLESENPSESEYEAVRELAEYFPGLPLSLAQAGLFMCNQCCSFAEYIQ